ncbi:hypothetical protein [Psychromonas arctica]|uniref:hypothetical protein n=1 Tax=Psychromonas arctica TaxID=168275 RepID=UPI000427523E|nr:hypothetical protein [Psychromonas arctica]
MSNSLESKSWREAVFYANNLREMFGINSNSLINQAKDLTGADSFLHQDISDFTPERIRKCLAGTIQKPDDNDLKAVLISLLKKSFHEKEQLTNDAFEWIKNDRRICAFCYHFLKENSPYSRAKEEDYDPKGNREPLQNQEERGGLNSILNGKNAMRLFDIRPRNKMPNSHQERLEIIKCAFWEGEVSMSGQQYIMSLLSEAWVKSFKEKTNIKLFRWLDGNDKQKVEWLHNYMEKQIKRLRLPWEAINDEERYFALQADFDYQFLKNPVGTESLFLKARLAWNQMTARNKENGPKSRGISMSKRTSERLDWLANNKDQKINSLIKDLIDNEFERLRGPSNS